MYLYTEKYKNFYVSEFRVFETKEELIEYIKGKHSHHYKRHVYHVYPDAPPNHLTKEEQIEVGLIKG
tara:strand:+ start:5101 stop:5301 length:201 start_codon:yes stop_codon:yes gene_type:complete